MKWLDQGQTTTQNPLTVQLLRFSTSTAGATGDPPCPWCDQNETSRTSTEWRSSSGVKIYVYAWEHPHKVIPGAWDMFRKQDWKEIATAGVPEVPKFS